MTEKKDVWLINVRRIVTCSVAFEEEVDSDEALELFHNGEEMDIVNEDVVSEEIGDLAE